MNSAQKRFVASWVLALAIVLLVGIFDDWILERWSVLWLPALVLLFVAFALRRDAVSYTEGRERTLEIIERYPIIKLWLAGYSLCIAVTLFAVLARDINPREFIGPFELFLLLIPIFGPIWFVAERNKYRSLGNQPNPRMEADAP